METVEKIIEKIKEVAEENQKQTDVVHVIDIPRLKNGECYRQGDLYIFKVDDNYPVGSKVDRRQLANGTSIGQRHVLLGGNFQVYEGKQLPDCYKDPHLYERAGALGYAFDLYELNDDCRNGHPEHRHFRFQQTGRYQVCHQIDLQTMQRVAD